MVEFIIATAIGLSMFVVVIRVVDKIEEAAPRAFDYLVERGAHVVQRSLRERERCD